MALSGACMTERSWRLIGLPGCGKSRLQQANLHLSLSLNWVSPFTSMQFANDRAILLLDVRKTPQLPQDQWLLDGLKRLLLCVDGVIFHFMESAELSSQTYWQGFLREFSPNLPVVRSFYQQLPAGEELLGVFSQTLATHVLAEDALNWQTFEFAVSKVSLEHLMMGLANSQQSLGMRIARVQANLHTLEYENSVALEVSPFNWNTFATDESLAKKLPAGRIRVSGQALDESWLQQIIHASCAE